MKITIHDTDLAPTQGRSPRLATPAVEIATVLYGIALLRVSLGLLFMAHGLLKVMVFTLPGTAQFFTTVGLPRFMATPVAMAEIGGGLLLIAGIYSRFLLGDGAWAIGAMLLRKRA